MKPAAPVTRMGTAASYASSLVSRVSVEAVVAVAVLSSAAVAAAELLRVADLVSSALERPGALEMVEGFSALAELRERRAEVVLRVRLVRLTRAGERGDRLPGDRLGGSGIAFPEQRGCLVGQGCAALSRWRRRRWGRGMRRWRRFRWRRWRGCRLMSLRGLLLIPAVREERRESRACKQRRSDDRRHERPPRPALRGRQHARRRGTALGSLPQRCHETEGGCGPSRR